MEENFDIEMNKSDAPELTMTVSPVCGEGDGRYAFISFSDGKRTAEGKIPDCVITKNEGFSDEEKEALEEYMKKELKNLKHLAASQSPFKAMMKE